MKAVNIDYAHAYARLGWPVFPTRPVGEQYTDGRTGQLKTSDGKQPRTPNGYQDASTDVAQIESWFANHSDRGLGFWPGPAGLLVLDVDIKDGKQGDKQLQALQDSSKQTLPTTLKQCSPSGGWHLFYRLAPGVQIGGKKLPACPDVDIRSQSGYVCVEGTITDAGGYGFEDWDPLTDGPPEIADAPSWLVDLLTKVNSASKPSQLRLPAAPAAVSSASAIWERLPPELRELIQRGVPDGQRSDQFHHAVGWCKDLGLTEGETAAVLLAHPEGIAAKFAGRVPGEVARCWGKVQTVTDPSAPWPDLQPLVNIEEPQPYPVDCLPPLVRDAIVEVQDFVQAPMAMVATSAISAISLACQGFVDVQRDQVLQGPTSIFTLVVGESGERKTSCDRYFTLPLYKWEQEQSEAMAPIVKQHMAAMDSWGAKREGLLAKIRDNAKSKTPCDSRDLDAELEAHMLEKPEAPKVPRLFYSDITTEQLGLALAKTWPSAGVFVNEAAEFFGGHSMKGDNLMQALGFFNKAWDAQVLRSDRKTTESWETRGARLTVALAVQEAVLRDFAEKGGDKVRGSGFWARYLVAVPASTQGQRPYKEPPLHWPYLSAFHAAMQGVLAQPLPLDEKGDLRPVQLRLSPVAKQMWVEYFNAVEHGLRTGGSYQDVRDVASKSADQAARLAALLHCFEHGPAAGLLQISDATMVSACTLAAWHLEEARRFFGELAMPQDLADAMRVERWLIDWVQRRADPPAKRDLQQYGPNDLRKAKGRRECALQVLMDENRLRMVQQGRKTWMQLHPDLEGSKP